MSLGYTGMCKKVLEDKDIAIYSYAGENWNDENSKSGDTTLQDGSFIIYKECLEKPEIHIKTKKMPSGRKKTIEKRITHTPDIVKHMENGKIVIEKECKNAFKRSSNMKLDYIAYCLLVNIFESYQMDGQLPEEERFIQ